MDIKKNIEVEISVFDGHPDCCGLCRFHDPDNDYCILFQEDLSGKRISNPNMSLPLRLEECQKKFPTK